MKFTHAILLLTIFGFLLAGCTNSTKDAANNTDLTIYTSIYPIQYAVERIGGDTVSVHSVYPPGVDAHTYEPTSKEMTAIAGSDAFIYLGAGMEGFAESAAGALASQDITLVELGTNKELFHTDKKKQGQGDTQGESHNAHDGHTHGDHDPHIWLDPIRMADMGEMIEQALIELNPDKADYYTANFNKLQTDLQTLDEDFQAVLQAKTNKEILVSHAAYGYWEERYGIEQIAINGQSSSNEPSQKELTKIVDQAKKYEMNYIIFEQNSSNRISEIIQSHIGAEALTIHNLSVLTENDIKNNEDYLSLMESNLEVLDKATK